MKNLFTALFVSIVFIIAGCGSEQEGHSHGEDGDHTHEAPAQQSSEDGDAVRIGSGKHTVKESDHSHDEDSDHSYDEEHGHIHDADSTHSHGDEEQSH